MKKDFIGRVFHIKKANCYILCQDYFKEKGIILKDIDYDTFTPKSFLAMAIEQKFELVKSLSDVIKDDVFITKEPTHLLIYIGNDTVLHHPLDSISRREYINQDILDSIKYIVRRKTDA